jgi:hypothetical protein
VSDESKVEGREFEFMLGAPPLKKKATDLYPGSILQFQKGGALMSWITEPEAYDHCLRTHATFVQSACIMSKFLKAQMTLSQFAISP